MHRVISLLFLALAAAFSGCGEPPFHYEPPFMVTDRHPFNAVVWVFKDESPEAPAFAIHSPEDGSAVYNFSLTRGGSAWRPQLSMERLSAALAAEIQAKVTETAEVREDAGGTVEAEAQGTKLFVEGTVQEASWKRTKSGGGTFHLKIDLAATVARPNASDLHFWNRTVEIDVPHLQHAGPELAAALRSAFDDAVDSLGQELDEEQQAEALLKEDSDVAGETPAAETPAADAAPAEAPADEGQ
jgi:hypothetical protein